MVRLLIPRFAVPKADDIRVVWDSKSQARIMEYAMGSPENINSEFQWSRVVLNLPTMNSWDPSLPRVMRIRDNGELASSQVRYVDDIHPTARGVSNASARRASR
eukprot:CCRYP_019100-RA/>CCRYP_019100-RA protein AED:0.46 eAED:0.46 QI:0/0/0/1/0/0/2/0/103